MQSLFSLLNWGTEALSENQIPTPRLDAEVLLAHLLGIDRVQLYVQPDRKMSEYETVQFKKWIERRMAGEPVSYIRGLKEFWSLSLRVGPGVMVPRPDTEVLVECVLQKLSPSPRPSPIKGEGVIMNFPSPLVGEGEGEGGMKQILDIGTGSGNIAIALAKEYPQAKITAIDISEEALVFARENAQINGVENRIVFLKENFLHGNLQHQFDLIVSNPPYISSAVIETLDPGIRSFEPCMALDGGADGLDFYRRMGETFPSLLKPGGMIVVEIGEDQATQVTEIFKKGGLSDIEVVKDYAGLPRVVMAHYFPLPLGRGLG